MRRPSTPSTADPALDPVARRTALKGLGALVVAVPTLGSLGCGTSEPAQGEPVDGAIDDPSEQDGEGDGGKPPSEEPGPDAAADDSGEGQGEPSTPDAEAASDDGGDATPTRPVFDDAASCNLTTTDIEGPFFIDDHEIPDDVSLVRSDIREGHPGAEFRFYFRLLDADNACAPIPDAEIYIWHCDADGYYSGFEGQNPARPYTGAAQRTPENSERFCRGVQLTDAEGIVGFTTIYPGWYAGRPIHVHLLARLSQTGPRLITTQLYFPAAFTTEVHESEPAYMGRAASMPAASRNPPSGDPAMPSLEHTPGLVVGTLNVIVRRA